MYCLLEPNDPDWLRWVEWNSSANIFHHPAWMKLLSTSYGYRTWVLAVRDQHGQITAGTPFMEVKSIGKNRRWVSLPFTDHCRPLSSNPISLEELLAGLTSQFLQAHPSMMEVRWHFPSLPSAQFSSHHVLHQMDLQSDPNRVRGQFHSMHRRNIKIAENSGIRIEQGCSEKHLREFYRLHLITRRRQGMPTQPWRFFWLLGKRMLEQGLGFVVLAYKEERCIAASVFLKWQKSLMYKYGASAPDSLQYRPNNLVMWSAIRWGCENGFSVLDMGRTDNDNTGLRQYKSGWGALETPLVYTVLSEKPVSEDNGRSLQILQKVLQNSPIWVSQLAGQILYKYFG